MFNLDKVHMILDEMIMNGQIVETNKNRILAPVSVLDKPTSWYRYYSPDGCMMLTQGNFCSK